MTNFLAQAAAATLNTVLCQCGLRFTNYTGGAIQDDVLQRGEIIRFPSGATSARGIFPVKPPSFTKLSQIFNVSSEATFTYAE